MADEDEDLQALLTCQGEMVGSVAHDLKGLLSGLEGGLYLLRSGIEKRRRERIDDGFDMVGRNVARIRRAVASTLYYVKPRAIDWQDIDAAAALSGVQEALAERATELGVELRIAAPSGALEGDAFAVHSLLTNLAEYLLHSCNLARRTPAPTVTLTAAPRDANLVFELHADGCELDDAARATLLAPDYLPRGADRSHLGVFIARRLVASHRGHFEIGAAPAGTTRFVVALPARRAAEGPA